ncbi:hypothetical protein CCP3SC1AL1_3000002 [Gammaproteobacteria bacterium]
MTTKLLEKINAPGPISEVLAGVHTAPDLPSALALRKKLNFGESVVTPEGFWLSRGWLRVSHVSDKHAGVLLREQEIQSLRSEFLSAETKTSEIELALREGQTRLANLEQDRENTTAQLHEATRNQAEIVAKLGNTRSRLEQIQLQRERIQRELQETADQTQENLLQEKEVRNRLHEALQQVETFSEKREQIEKERAERRTTLDQIKTLASSERERAHRLALETHTLESRLAAARASFARAEAQVSKLAYHSANLSRTLAEIQVPTEEWEKHRARHKEAEEILSQARVRKESTELRLRELSELSDESEAEEIREALTSAQMAYQEIAVRVKTLEEQATGMEISLPEVLATLPLEAEEKTWQERLDSLGRRLQRVGAVNLAAIEEHQAISERAQVLGTQCEDLRQAVATLEAAIHRIDREIRRRFQETFDQVNAGLKNTFPRLFGGGSAMLKMTSEDLLEAGITIMAHPPGKRNSTIYLLSGGEKALTAVALLFSLFQQNPSPVCLLDEVDAPLDDANVGRFCQLVQEMSGKTQFVFITHNKTTMEMAHHLVGVTMQESGVSRLVTVFLNHS